MEKVFLVKTMKLEICILISLVSSLASAAQITGSYSLTGNSSVENTQKYYFGHKLQLNLKNEGSSHSFDFRDENYSEASYHGTDPNEVVVENKAETQLNYNYAFNENVSWYVGALHHANYTFRDTYSWYLTGLSLNISPYELFSLSATLSAIQRGQGGRVFYDGSLGVEKTVFPMFSVFGALHRYENFGESDTSPSKKTESEFGLNHTPSARFSFGLSYFQHTQDGDPLDAFSAYRLRATYLF